MHIMYVWFYTTFRGSQTILAWCIDYHSRNTASENDTALCATGGATLVTGEENVTSVYM